MAYGDRTNAIKQEWLRRRVWLEDSLKLLRELCGDPSLSLPSLSKMTSDDLSNLYNALDTIKREHT